MEYKSYRVKLFDLIGSDSSTNHFGCTEAVANYFIERVNTEGVFGELPLSPVLEQLALEPNARSAIFRRVWNFELSRVCIKFTDAAIEDGSLYATLTPCGAGAEEAAVVFNHQESKGLPIRDVLRYRCLMGNKLFWSNTNQQVLRILTFDLCEDSNNHCEEPGDGFVRLGPLPTTD